MQNWALCVTITTKLQPLWMAKHNNVGATFYICSQPAPQGYVRNMCINKGLFSNPNNPKFYMQLTQLHIKMTIEV